MSGTTVLSEWTTPPTQAAVTAGSAALHRFSYNAATKTYSRDAEFPVTLHRGSTESITVAKDSLDKLWVTYTVVSSDLSNRVYVNHSTTSDTAWGTPFVLPTTNADVHHDDISAVASFQGNKIGIMWSNQRVGHKRFYLATHQDGQPEQSWQTEVAYGGGNNCSGGCANDHLNLRQLTSDGSGRLYAAIKTAKQGAGLTFVALLVRDGNGQWTSTQYGTVEDAHTRPMVMIDEEHRQLYMFAIAPEAGGTLYYKKSPLDNVSFAPGPGTPIISSSTDKDINDPTSTKQNVNGQTGLVVLTASRTNARYWHAHLDLGGPTTPPPGGGTTQTVTVDALEDSYVSGSAATTDNGSATALGADGSPAEVSYLKFDLGTLSGRTITEAKLQLQATNGSTGNQRVKLVQDDLWNENAIRFNARPLPGTTPIGTLTGASSAGTYSVNLDKNVLQAELGQSLSLAVDSSSSDGLDFASSEAATAASRPKLILTLTSP
ncbi:DNRLRE domain-containing protein [Pseudarthrobacter oxydans]|uniref:CBM96 family carbohydrate-binding protein n=1 Tax=Pseudarthrobacter oxydans TaxID=1671 RepID=UPI003D2CD325